MVLFETIRYTILRANIFFRTIRASGVWIPDGARRKAVEAGHDMNVSG